MTNETNIDVCGANIYIVICETFQRAAFFSFWCLELIWVHILFSAQYSRNPVRENAC